MEPLRALNLAVWGLAVSLLVVACDRQGAPPTQPKESGTQPASQPAGPVVGQAIVVEGMAYSLVSSAGTYFVGEPLRVALHVKNLSASTRAIPEIMQFDVPVTGPNGYEVGGGSFGSTLPEEERSMPPGAERALAIRYVLVDLRLPGSYQMQYRSRSATTTGKDEWVTPPIAFSVVAQKLVIPPGTTKRVQQALRKLEANPSGGGFSARPGWTQAHMNDAMTEMEALGQSAVPALLANLNNCALEDSIIQILGDMKVKEAVPALLNRLRMADGFHDSLIIAKLAEITEHPDGYKFHRQWFNPKIQAEAVETYRAWWAQYVKDHPSAATQAITAPAATGQR